MHAIRQSACENFFNLQSLKAEFEGKRFEWRIEQTLQRPRVVSARTAPVLTKENLFAQVVVRLHTAQVTGEMHTLILHFSRHYHTANSCLTAAPWLPPYQDAVVPCCMSHAAVTRLPLSLPSLFQVLALYNTAGKLLRGHASRAKKVIDYVVFERHLMKPESRWRIAGKLPPQRPWQEVGKNSERSSLEPAI